MTDFLTDYGVLIALVCAGAAVLYGALVTQRLLRLSPGNERMQEISGAVQEGAKAYLNRQYLIIAVVAIPLAILIAVIQDVTTGIGFVIGGALSGAAGFIGMNLSVRANARVAEAARGGVPPALDVAFKGGSVTGLLVVGLALLGVAGYFGILVLGDKTDEEAIDALIGLGFGGSLISVFARLGGGIFTKAADVGADLVGKVEAGIPEDDPRNPAVIADNVGDNVGDCAGMAADLFETYAVTSVAVMLLGVLTFAEDFSREVAMYPLVMGAVAIIASIVGALAVRTTSDKVEGALYRGLIVSAVISAAAFYPITDWLMSDPLELGVLDPECPRRRQRHRSVALRPDRARRHRRPVRDHRLLHVDPLPAGEDDQPGVANRSRDQHHPGARAGLPVDRRAGAAAGARDPRRERARRHLRDRRRGDGAALALRPDRRPRRLRPDHRQRGRHRRDGRAAGGRPQRHRPARRRRQHDQGGDQGYAIGSAALAALVLFKAFEIELAREEGGEGLIFSISDPAVLIGLLIGGLMVYLFSALAIEAVGRAGGQVVEEVRRQFREDEGIMKGTSRPEYGRTVAIVTAAAQREMILPSLIPIVIPVIVGIIDVKALGGC